MRVLPPHCPNHWIHVLRTLSGARDDRVHHHVQSERCRPSQKIRLAAKNYPESPPGCLVCHRLSLTLASISGQYLCRPGKHLNPGQELDESRVHAQPGSARRRVLLRQAGHVCHHTLCHCFLGVSVLADCRLPSGSVTLCQESNTRNNHTERQNDSDHMHRHLFGVPNALRAGVSGLSLHARR